MINSNRRIIKLFDSVPKFDTYSRYSVSLEKVFHENSLKNLIKNLKEEKRPKIYSYFDVDGQIIEPNRFNRFRQRKNNKKDNSKNNLLYDEGDINNNKEKEVPNQIIISESNEDLKKKIRYKPDSDPFRYNPNYNSILKKIPCVKIIKPPKIENKSPFVTEIGDIAVSSNNPNKKKNIFLAHLKNKNLASLKMMKDLNIRKKKFPIDLNEDKNNHSIRFDKYSGRKELKSEKNPNISYLEPFTYTNNRNNSIDFNKMLSRTDNKTINQDGMEGPTIGCYNPHYEYFEDRIRNISLSNEHVKNRDKKFLLKKIWGSYNVRLEYILIDNNKLKKEIGKNNNGSESKYVPNYTEPNKAL